MTKSGVYKITNEVTGKFYIGSSKDIDARFERHKTLLRTNNHVNTILQRSWNKYGPGKFTFAILENIHGTKDFQCTLKVIWIISETQ